MSEIPAGDDHEGAAVSFAQRRGAMYAAGFLAIIGVVFVWQSLALAFGQLTLPGPGFFPLVLGLLLAAFGGAIFFGDLRRPCNGETVALGHRKVLVVAAAMLATPVLFEPLGAYVTLGLFSGALLILLGRVSIATAAVSALVFMGGCFYFFQVLLGVQLPKGPF